MLQVCYGIMILFEDKNYPSKIRSMIVLFMVRGLRRFSLTGGPTIALNFETCSKVSWFMQISTVSVHECFIVN
uniref:Uncharacterized protein n=1 Tax=Trichogramma kaykai TaxID=54128 RepID=A0ABD2VZ77_9HYME